MKASGFVLAVAMLLAACNSSSSPTISKQKEDGKAEYLQYEVDAVALDTAAVPIPPEVSKTLTDNSGEKAIVPPFQRQIIRTAHVEMQCKDFKAFNALAHQHIKRLGGFAASEQESQSEYQRQNVLEIKVPVEKFDELVQSLSSLEGTLTNKKIESADVTNAIIDTKGRIEAKKLVRARYYDLLGKAQKMEDILQVQQQINSITEDLESATYNMANMQAQAAMSTIYFSFAQPVEGYVSGEEPGKLNQLWDAVGKGANGIWHLAIGLISVWPLLLLAIAALFWWKRRKSAA